VSFQDRNKVLRINSSTIEGDVACLEKEFFRAFARTVSEGQIITFQRFYTTWDSFVNLEEGDMIEDRHKLKAVVSEPTCSQPNTSSSGNIVSLEVNDFTPHLTPADLEHTVSFILEMFSSIEHNMMSFLAFIDITYTRLGESLK